MSQAPSTPSFDAALARALQITTRRRNTAAAAASVLVLIFFGVVFATTKNPLIAAQTLIPLPVIWFIALNGGQTARALRRLRGGQPQHWLPSSSHGVLVIGERELVAGGVYGALDRHAESRVESVAYDEARHVITVDLHFTAATADGEDHRQQRATVHFDEQVTKEQAAAFAAAARERATR